jgi:transposase
MRSTLYWLSDEQWQRIEPLLPTDVRGAGSDGCGCRARLRRVIDEIIST